MRRIWGDTSPGMSTEWRITDYLKTIHREWWEKVEEPLLTEIIEGVLAAQKRVG